MKIQYLLLILLCVFQNVYAVAQITPEIQADLDFKLDSMRQVLNVKGLSASLISLNGETWDGTAGISSESPLVSISSDMTFGIASVTKTVTAACIFKLVDQGLINLNDSLYEFVDPIENIDTTITILELLRHKSGLRDFTNGAGFNQAIGADILFTWDQREVLETFQPPPFFPPGGNFRYSNSNYLLLGLIVEDVFQMDFHLAARELVLDDLNLDSFKLFPMESISMSNPAHLWLDITGDNIGEDASSIFTNWYSLHSAVSFAGAYYATPNDCAKWIRTYSKGELFSSESFDIISNTLATNLPFGSEYGAGIMRRIFGEFEGLGHGGDISYSTLAFHIPSLDATLSLHCNDFTVSSWDLTNTFRVLLEGFASLSEVLSSDNNQDELSLQIYPNPFQTEFVLRIPNGAEVERVDIADLTGKVVYQKSDASSNKEFRTIDLSSLSNGCYICHVLFNEGTRISKRIIKSY